MSRDGGDASASMNGLLLGERFALEREIGSGGMARVFLGKDTVLERPVAVKLLNPGHDETDIGSRFRREGRTAARLSHPNIVQVYDAGEADLSGNKVSYIVMEYISGGDLKDMIDRQGSLSEADLARLGAGAAAGLAHAHERGVIHRDIKPHNVLIDSYGEPKLTDFGIARALDVSTSHATRTGSYLGTALYSAPEQLQGLKVTPKSDVYALGVTLYQAAVGEVPFVGTPMEVAGQHIHQPPAPPRSNGAGAGRIESLILDCLAKDPELRPTAEEVRDRLREESSRIREEAMRPPPVEPPPPAFRPTPQTRTAPTTFPVQQGSRRRSRRPLLLGAAALLLVLLGIATYALSGVGGSLDTASTPPPEGEQVEAPAENAEPAAEPETPPREEPEQQAQPQDEPLEQPRAEQQEAPPDDAQDAAAAASQGTEESPAEGAERAVEQFYTTAANGEYETSLNLLGAEWRQANFSSPGSFEGTFETLQSIEFVEGPTAQVSGDEATVTGTTIATHGDRIERNQGTWTLVNDGGEWFITGWTLSNLSTT